MRRAIIAGLALWLAVTAHAAEVKEHVLVSSPGGRISVLFGIDGAGVPRYSVQQDGKPVLMPSRLGVVREDADFSKGLSLSNESAMEPMTDDYQLLTIKRRSNHYSANRRSVDLVGPKGEHLLVHFQVSDDGVAFRHEFPRVSANVHRLKSEASSYRFLPGTHAWLQPMAGEDRLEGREPVLRRDLRAGHRGRHASADRSGLGVSGAVPIGRRVVARQ